MANETGRSADQGPAPWEWSLLTDIELLEELLAEHGGLFDADDALAIREVALSRALQRRRAAWREAPGA